MWLVVFVPDGEWFIPRGGEDTILIMETSSINVESVHAILKAGNQVEITYIPELWLYLPMNYSDTLC